MTIGVACSLLLASPQDKSIGRLDGSRAFWYPGFASDANAVVATTKAGPIDTETYLRYLSARFGTELVDDLAFDLLLVAECKALGVAGSAPTLAKPLATRRLHESGRTAKDDPDGSLRRGFVNEALRQHRLDAIVGDARAKDDELLKDLFDRQFGVDGIRVQVRHVLVSLSATARRSGSNDTTAIEAAARAKAEQVLAKLEAGEKFETVLADSDDRVSRRAEGVIEGYNYRRFGESFAAAVRAAKIGRPVGPVRTSKGFHVLEVTDRKKTALAKVEARLRRQLRGMTVSPADAKRLRKRLFRKYGYEPR